MNKVIYWDVNRIHTEADEEDGELLNMFQGRTDADRLVLALDHGMPRILPKSALWAMARAAELEREQIDRDAERETLARERRAKRQRDRCELRRETKRKRWEDRITAAMAAAGFGTVAVCTGAMLSGHADPIACLAVMEAVLVCVLVVMAAKRRGCGG